MIQDIPICIMFVEVAPTELKHLIDNYLNSSSE